MINRIYSISAIFILLFIAFSCEKEKVEAKPEFKGIKLSQNGNVTVKMNHLFGTNNFDLDPVKFYTAAGDTIRFTDLKYYISHVTFTKADGSSVNLMNNHLLDHNTSNTSMQLSLPAGNYTGISFLLGVDSVNNFSGLQEGALDPAYGMFWTWSTGYIYYGLKGWHDQKDTSIAFVYDIGGYKNLVKISLDLSAYKIESNNVKIDIKHDVQSFFNTPNIIDLKTMEKQVHTENNIIIPLLKPNMQNMFSIINVHQ
jgi:hypothetical protein